MEFTKEMVDDYADKLLIGLTRDENKMVLDEFKIIDKQISIINSFDNILDVEPMCYAIDDIVVELRDDLVEDSVCIEDLLSNAGSSVGREVEIVKVVS